jgi:hypothetical protein
LACEIRLELKPVRPILCSFFTKRKTMKATELRKQQKAARVNRAFKISGAGATAALLLLSGQANAQAKPPEPKETPIYSQPLPTASIVETFLLQAHTT